jgi:acyl carrier protein
MNKEEIFNTILLTCRTIFNDSDLELSFDSTADQVDQWDSVTHIQLILEIEKNFNMRFSLGELQKLKRIGNLVELVSEKLSEA